MYLDPCCLQFALIMEDRVIMSQLQLPVHSPVRQSVQDILAGTAGGLMTVLVGHPLDTIK